MQGAAAVVEGEVLHTGGDESLTDGSRRKRVKLSKSSEDSEPRVTTDFWE